MIKFTSGKLRLQIVLSFLITLLPVIIFIIMAVQLFLVPVISQSARNELINSTRVLTSAVEASADVAVRNHLKAIAERNLEIALHHFSLVEQNILTKAEAITRLERILLSQQVGSSGYLYCLNSQGDVVVHPNKKLLNTNVSEFAFVQNQIKNKTGYIEYDWRNPDEIATREKALYMVYFEPLDWIISASSYRAEFSELLNPEDFREMVLSANFGKTGYAYLLNHDGQVLIHPKYRDFNILEQEELPSLFVEEMLFRKSGFTEYEWQNPDESILRKKLAAYETIPEYEWLVVSSLYVEELFEPVNIAKLIAYCTTLLLIVITIIISYFLSGKISKPVDKMIVQLDQNAKAGEHIPLPVSGDNELSRLGREFNRYLAKIEKQTSELKKQQIRYQELFEANPDAIFILDGPKIIKCNRATFDLFGGIPSDIIGRTVIDFSPPFQPDGQESSKKALQFIAAANDSELLEFKWLHTNIEGKPFDAEVRLKPFGTDSSGRPLILTFLRNITEQLKMEAALQQAQKMEAIGTLAGGVAHDLNNILSGIVSYPELLLAQIPKEHKFYNPLITIKNSGQKAAIVVEDLLTMARRGVAQYEPILMTDLIIDFLKSHEFKELGKYNSGVIFKFFNYATHSLVMGSTVHLTKSLMNLVNNAAEAISTEGSVTISLSNVYVDHPIKAYDQVKEGEYLLLSIEDTGSGIAPNNLDKIFEPFFTTKSMGRSGSGLGMAVVWGTVKDHNGYIDVQSTEGKGTIFKIFLPFIRSDFSQTIAQSTVDHKGHGKGETILVIDDVEEQREIAVSLLHHLDYDVNVVDSGEAAIESLINSPVDLVVLDMLMAPGMDGLETFKKIIELYPNQKTIIVSGFSENDKVKEAQKLGAGLYLKKPYTIDELASAVRQTLDRKNI